MVVFGIILVAATAAIAIPILSTPAETWEVVPFAAFGTIVAATVAALGALAVAQTYAALHNRGCRSGVRVVGVAVPG